MAENNLYLKNRNKYAELCTETGKLTARSMKCSSTIAPVKGLYSLYINLFYKIFIMWMIICKNIACDMFTLGLIFQVFCDKKKEGIFIKIATLSQTFSFGNVTNIYRMQYFFPSPYFAGILFWKNKATYVEIVTFCHKYSFVYITNIYRMPYFVFFNWFCRHLVLKKKVILIEIATLHQ